MTQQTTTETNGSAWPGATSGMSTEFTLIIPLKPGGAQRLREEVLPHVDTTVTDRVGTLHEARLVIFDNDT
jgi:hypothetical protein